MRFKIKFADHIVGINAEYEYVRQLCKEYIVLDEEPDFWIEPKDDDKKNYAPIISKRNNQCDECEIDSMAESMSIFSQLAERFAEYDELFIHSAIVAVDGIGYGFLAPSGIGKTTHIMLWKELLGDRCEIINGDQPLVGIKKGRIYASGTPWCGKEKYSANKIVPIKAMAFIERSETNSIERLTPLEAEKKLYYSVLFSGGMRENILPIIQLVNRLSRNVDFYLLKCNMDIEAARIAYKNMSGGFYNEA